MENIRNFCIIAHIDHGKSTLADRLLEFTGTLNERQMEAQVLDNMDLEKEKGITIKSHAIQMNYTMDGKPYVLNLIDTPGHVDFSYEVSRSIAACEGALLIVDASQGIEAQTISNLYLALEHDLEIIPVLNKIDLPHAMPEEVTDEIVELVGCKREDVIRASAKEGKGIEEILRAVVNRVKAPKGDPKAPLQAMIFDSVYNSFRGIEVYFRVLNGTIKTNDKIQFVNTGQIYNADEIGVLKLDKFPGVSLASGADGGWLGRGVAGAAHFLVLQRRVAPEGVGRLGQQHVRARGGEQGRGVGAAHERAHQLEALGRGEAGHDDPAHAALRAGDHDAQRAHGAASAPCAAGAASRASPRQASRTSSAGRPAVRAASGTRLWPVKPGNVLSSRKTGTPSGRTMKSTRGTPRSSPRCWKLSGVHRRGSSACTAVTAVSCARTP